MPFLRGAFLAGGLCDGSGQGLPPGAATTSHSFVSPGDVLAHPGDAGRLSQAGQPKRGGSSVLYLKQSELHLRTFSPSWARPWPPWGSWRRKLEKELNNKVNRRCNCDDANTSKVVEAAQEQLAAIRHSERRQGASGVHCRRSSARRPGPGWRTPPASNLTELAGMMDPPITQARHGPAGCGGCMELARPQR